LANKKNKHLNIQSLEDMHDVISKTPELVAFQSTVEKHTNLSWDLLQEMKKGELHEVSRVEQDLICQDSRKDSIEGIWKLMKNNEIDYFHKLKLVILYSVRFPNDKEIKEFLSFLENINPDKTMLSLVSLIQQYQYNRKSDLFHSRNLKKKAVSFFERILKDVPSVFTGHKPYLFENVLPDLIFDRAKES
jgi:vacuolar protein sorting-associated protein 45